MLTERMFEKMMVMVVMIDEGSHVTGLWEVTLERCVCVRASNLAYLGLTHVGQMKLASREGTGRGLASLRDARRKFQREDDVDNVAL